MEIFGVGHSNLRADELLAVLSGNRIALVVDVRRFPVSKRHPQHARPALEAALSGAGIAYEFLGGLLGGRLEPEIPIELSENRALREPAFRAYADALESLPFSEGLARLETLAREHRSAVLCAERDWRHCHRRILADVLVARGWSVVHLERSNVREAHTLDPHARSLAGRLTYPSLL